MRLDSTDGTLLRTFTRMLPSMQEANEQHMAICESCRKEMRPFHSWLCVICDTFGYGFGCPTHAHTEDNSVLV